MIRSMRAAAVLTLSVAASMTAIAQEKPSAPKPSESALAVMGRVIARYGELHSLTYSSVTRFTFETPNGGFQAVIRNTTCIARPNRFCVDSTVAVNDQRPVAGRVVCDGKTIWELDTPGGVYAEYPAAPILGSHTSAENWIFERIGQDLGMVCFLKLTDSEELRPFKSAIGAEPKLPAPQHIGGVPAYVIDLPMPSGDPSKERMALRLQIDAQTLLIQRCILQAADSGERAGLAPLGATIATTYQDLKANAEIPDARFEFRPPAGARQVEHLESLLNRVVLPLMQRLGEPPGKDGPTGRGEPPLRESPPAPPPQ